MNTASSGGLLQMVGYTTVGRYCRCLQCSCMLMAESRPEAMLIQTSSALSLLCPIPVLKGTPVAVVKSLWNFLRWNGRSSHGASIAVWQSLGSV